VQLLVLQLLLELLSQWSNIWDASALQTLSLTDYSTLLAFDCTTRIRMEEWLQYNLIFCLRSSIL
jgi:hypothetical protein